MVSKGTVDVAAVTVSKTQTFDFVDNTGVLRLVQPNEFQASITGFQTGDSIDLPGIKADTATWSSNTLTIANSGTTVATLSLQGDYSQDKFTVASDGATGSAITVTAICYAAGTRILTPRGEVPIERLHRDELVMTSQAARSRSAGSAAAVSTSAVTLIASVSCRYVSPHTRLAQSSPSATLSCHRITRCTSRVC